MKLAMIAVQQALASARHRAQANAMSATGVFLGTGVFGSVQSYRESQLVTGLAEADANRLLWFSWLASLMALAGIGNLMLHSIMARFQEIGTLKCLGASNWLIVLIYGIEAVLVGAMGAVVGAFAGPMLGAIMAGQPLVPAVIVRSFLVGMALALGATIVPLIEAVRLSATASLRGSDT